MTRTSHAGAATAAAPRQAGRSALRGVRRAALALALPAFLALAAATQAHAETLVSNLGQADGVGTAFSQFDLAQEFTTGSSAGGYRLDSVTWRFTAAGSGVTVKVGTGTAQSIA